VRSASRNSEPRASRARCAGFTLLEVLVALAIVATALGALVYAGGTFTGSAADLRERTFAHWVAMNQTALAQARSEAVETGTSAGREFLAGRDWHWRMDVSTTDDPQVRRMEIEVRTSPAAAPASRLTAYLYAATGSL